MQHHALSPLLTPPRKGIKVLAQLRDLQPASRCRVQIFTIDRLIRILQTNTDRIHTPRAEHPSHRRNVPREIPLRQQVPNRVVRTKRKVKPCPGSKRSIERAHIRAHRNRQAVKP